MIEIPLPRTTGEEPCRKGDPERFHPAPGNPGKANAAKAECHGCPIERECLEYALRVGVSGIWGGTSEADRKKMRRRQGIVAAPVVPSEAELLHLEMVRLNRTGLGPTEIARHFRTTQRHVVRVLAEGRRQRQEELAS